MFDTLTLEKYAEVILWGLYRGRTGTFQKSDFVLVSYDHAALPLAEEVCAQLHDRGLIPVPRAAATPRMEIDRFTLANNKRLSTLIPGDKDLYNHLNGSISLIAPTSLSHLASVDPDLISLSQRARQPLRTIMHTREEMGLFGWTLCMYPTHALAAQAGLDDAAYAEQIRKACYLDDGTPIRKWALLAKQIEELRHSLTALGNCALHVESDTIDLRLSVGDQRTWAGLTGRNLPSFELYVSPDARTAEGVYTANLPSFRSGNIIRDVRLELKAGRVVSVQAEHSQEFVVNQLNMDEGASRLGEFALVDRRFSRISHFMANTLYDENHGGEWGSMHIALGNSYSNTYAGDMAGFTDAVRKNLGFNSSMLHWDLVNTGRKRVSAILADGTRRTLYEDGEFVL